MDRQIQIPYGSDWASFSVPEENLVGIFAPNPVEPCAQPDAAIEAALQNPLDLPPVIDLVKPGERVCILIDDYTRHTPCALIIPHLLDHLQKAGVRDENITILVSTGTHRPSTEEELRKKLGEKVYGRYRIAQNCCTDEHEQVFVGFTSRGTPVWVNRLAVETDHLMGIGHIDPSTFAGYAGGYKLVVPGVASLDTINANHSLIPHAFRQHGHTTSACRQDIDEAGALVRTSLFINVVLNQAGKLAQVFAGSSRAVYEAGVPVAKRVYEVKCPEPLDIAIGSGYPYDVDFYQSCRVIQFMDDVVKPGGSLVMVAPCPDGFGYPEFYDLMTVPDKPSHAFLRDIVRRNHKVTYNVLGYFLSRIFDEKNVYAVTEGIPTKEIEMAGMRKFADAQTAVDQLLTQYGKGARVGVFPVGSATIPRFESD